MIDIMSTRLTKLLTKFRSTERAFDAGAFVFHQDDPVRKIFCVAIGSIHLVRHQIDGSSIVLQRAAPGAIVAEASVFAKRYHCDAVAQAPTRALAFDRKSLLQRLATDSTLAEAWAAHLAEEVQSVRARAEILSLKTVAARLDAWIVANRRGLPIKGEWKTVAEEIGVSPEALYREMAKRRTA